MIAELAARRTPVEADLVSRSTSQDADPGSLPATRVERLDELSRTSVPGELAVG
jgi:hypothetical protein